MAPLTMSSNEQTKRLSPTSDTLRALFSRCGNICAFPGCSHLVIDEENLFIAQVCHIEAAEKGGQRFNKESTNEARRHVDNLMIMCYKHHKQTDVVSKYPVHVLREMKAKHEAQFIDKPSAVIYSDQFIDTVFGDLQAIKADTTELLEQSEKHDQKLDVVLKTLQQLQSASNEGNETGFNAEIDQIMEHRNRLNPRSSLLLFEDFKKRNWSKLNDLEKYRTVADMGICYIDLREEVKGANMLIEGLMYQPQNANALFFASLGYSILGNDLLADECIQAAKRIDCSIPRIYASEIRLKRHVLGSTAILSGVPEEMTTDAEVAYEIGMAFNYEKNYEEAINWLQLALDNASGAQREYKVTLAAVILESVYKPYDFLTGQISQNQKNKLRYAVELLTETWCEVKDTELRNSYIGTLINRSMAYKLLDKIEMSYQDAIDASTLEPSFMNLRHLALSALETNRIEKAEEVLNHLLTIATGEQVQDIELFRIELWSCQKDYKKTIEGLDQFLLQELEPKIRLTAEQMYITACFATGDGSTALRHINAIVRDFPDHLVPYINLAEFHSRSNQLNEVEAVLLTAYSKADNTSEPPDLHMLARLLAKSSLFDEAIDLYERIVDLKVYSVLTKELLGVYYNSGNHAQLLTACNGLFEIYGPIAYVTELQSIVFESIKDYELAIQTCEDHLAIYPNEQYILCRLVFICEKAGKKDLLKSSLGRFKHIDVKLPMYIQNKIALLFHKNQNTERARHILYAVRRNHYDKVEAHEAFVNINIEIDRTAEPFPEPTAATFDTAVTLNINGSNVTYILEDRNDPIASHGEVNINDEFGQLLIGTKTGDFVDWKKGDQTVQVIRLSNKFSYAISESMELLTTKFAHASSFRKFRLGDTGDIFKDASQVFDDLDKMESNDNRINEFYKDGVLTIGASAEIKGVNPLFEWEHLVFGLSLGIVTTGGAEEANNGNQLLKNGASIVLEPVAIMTLARLGCMDLLTLLTNKKLVSNSTVEIYMDLIRDLEKDKEKGSKMIGKINGKYRSQERTAEQVQESIEFYENVISWLRTHCEMLPAHATLKYNAKEKEKLNEMFGEAFIDSILAAQEKDSLLFADEYSLREVAMQQFQTSGCSTFVLLFHLVSEHKISSELFYDLWLKLFALNYKLLPVDPRLLYHSAKDCQFQLRQPFKNVLQGIVSDLVSDNIAIENTVHFIVALYEKPVTFIVTENIDFLRSSIIIECLNLLLKKYKDDFIRNRLLDVLSQMNRVNKSTIDIILSVVTKYFESLNN